ncbi:hypothetical protein BHM03_00021106 [Ensete ventricosum]|nr:hypothetical protein BHM03_00021106 [Ensete ventricosum]
MQSRNCRYCLWLEGNYKVNARDSMVRVLAFSVELQGKGEENSRGNWKYFQSAMENAPRQSLIMLPIVDYKMHIHYISVHRNSSEFDCLVPFPGGVDAVTNSSASNWGVLYGTLQTRSIDKLIYA